MRRFLALLLGIGTFQGHLRRAAADMPTADGTLVAESDDVAPSETKSELRKEHGVYVRYVDGVPTGEGTGHENHRKMKWGEGTVRHFNRTVVEGEEHPGRAYAESIKSWDINHGRKVAFKVALENFYTQFAPEKAGDTGKIIRMFEGEEAKLFEALEAKYGAKPDFDLSTLRYDFSGHKLYSWQFPEHEFWYQQACIDLDVSKALHQRVVDLIESQSRDVDFASLFVELDASDVAASEHREGMTYGLLNSHAQMELVRTVHINAYKYYQIGVELLMEYQDVVEQLDASERTVQEKAAEEAANPAATAAAGSDATAQEL